MTVLACSYRKDEISSLHETEGRELKKKKSQENILFKLFHHRNKVVVQK